MSIAGDGGHFSTLNINANTVVKGGVGRLHRVSVIASPGTAGGVYDTPVTGQASPANQVLSIPASAAAGTIYYMQWPCQSGIVALPGSNGVLALSYD